MTTARFDYRCRRCGEVFADGTETGFHNGSRALTQTSLNIDLGVGGVPLSLFANHRCIDGGIGLGDLIGCAKVEETTDD